jgi:hypothetical protein
MFIIMLYFIIYYIILTFSPTRKLYRFLITTFPVLHFLFLHMLILKLVKNTTQAHAKNSVELYMQSRNFLAASRKHLYMVCAFDLLWEI